MRGLLMGLGRDGLFDVHALDFGGEVLADHAALHLQGGRELVLGGVELAGKQSELLDPFVLRKALSGLLDLALEEALDLRVLEQLA